MKRKFLTVLAVICITVSIHAQVKVGDNPTTVNAHSALEIESTNKGLLMPRVALTALNNASPLSAFVAGMVVYNTATAGTAPNNVVPGIYYCDGTSWASVAVNKNQIGDIKSGFQTADHAGWVKLDGRLKSTLTATQQANATALGIGTNLPNATDKVLKQKSAGVNTTGGNLQDSVAMVQANLPNVSLQTDVAGAHDHNATVYPVGYAFGGGTIHVWNNADGGGSATNTSGIATAGNHQHTVSLNSGTQTKLYVENAYLSANMFIYLGN